MSRFTAHWRKPSSPINWFVGTQLVVQGLYGSYTLGRGQIPWVSLVVLVFSTVFYITFGFVYARKSQPEKPEKPEVNEQAFCGDCGAAKVKMEWQSGFYRATGKPMMQSILTCPAWTPGKPPSSYFDRDSYDCGNVVRSKISPAHTHEDGTIDADCPGCLARWAS